ncbi:MAG: hypothetical protein ACPGJS_21880 [Flammeovirgaceae bacterium]
MYAPELIEVKELMNSLKNDGLISAWELPYEKLLTRRSAAIFFVNPSNDSCWSEVQERLTQIDNFSFCENGTKELSKMKYRITF